MSFATRLLQIVKFVNVAPADTVTLPHNINVDGAPKIPDFIAGDVGGFTITADATTVTVTNTNPAMASVDVWLELKHTIPRQLSGGVANLDPQPFVAAAGGGGGGGGGTIAVQNETDPVGVFGTLNFEGPGVEATDAGGGVAEIQIIDAVIFDDAVPADRVNIRSDRASHQSPINNMKVGITNLSSNSSGAALGATDNYTTISGGNNNAATGVGATVVGGGTNTASGSYATAGGQLCTASGIASLAIGANATATAGYAISLGSTSAASGLASFAANNQSAASGDAAAAFGNQTQAMGDSSFTVNEFTKAAGRGSLTAGYNSETTTGGKYGEAHGIYAKSSRESQIAAASGGFSAQLGTAQTSQLVMRCAVGDTRSSGTLFSLLYGDGAGNTSIALDSNRAYGFRVHAICGGGLEGATSAYIIREATVRCDSLGTASVVAAGTQIITGNPTAVADWVIEFVAPGGNTLEIQFGTGTDTATTKIKVAARVEFVECPTSSMP